MPAAARSAFDTSSLRQRLAGLRRRLYLVATVRGVGWLLTVLLAAAVVAGVLDWRWHLPGLVRAVLLVGALTGAAVVALRYLLKPLAAKSDDLALALRVEERFPALNDALASTVQFLHQPLDTQHDSSSMRREAMRRAIGLMHGLDFNRVVDTRGLLSASLGMVCTVAVAALFLWVDPVLAKTALVRLAVPFGSREWPHLTRLDALEARYKNAASGTFTDWQALAEKPGTSPVLRVGKNYELQIQGIVKGRVIPDKVTVVFLQNSFPAAEHTCDVTLEEATKTHRFSTKLKPDQVQHDFSFYVRANDDASAEFNVKVLPPPVLVPLNGLPSPQVQLTFPHYTGLPSPLALPPGTGNVEAVAGTTVKLQAKADRPLQAAWIEYQPDESNVALAARLLPFGTRSALAVAALTVGGQTVWDRVPAQLDADRSRFSIAFLPRIHGNYVLHFEDDTGLGNSRTFELRLTSDPAPVVQLERPSAARDILQVLPEAELPLHVVADDPIFALRSVFIRYRTVRADEPLTLLLFDSASYPRTVLAPLTGPGLLAATDLELRPTKLTFQRTLSLKAIRHHNGWSLREGDLVILQAGADDFDDVTLHKQPGLSHEVELHVVSRAALELVLNGEQAKVQQDLLRLREKQREALKLVTEVENKLKRGDKPGEEDLAKLLQAEQTQQQIHERVGDQKEGLRAEVQRLLQTLKQNQLPNSAIKDRMQDVLKELNRLADKELEPIEQRLNQARKQAEVNDDRSRNENKAVSELQTNELKEKADALDKEAQKKEKQVAEDAIRVARLRHARGQGANGAAEELNRFLPLVENHQKEAAELRKQADQLKQQAERAGKKGDNKNDKQPRELLDEARLHQEEVEKTFNDLLTRLEPWSSTREIKGEANKLLEEQRKLAAEVEDLKSKERDFLGRKFEELSPKQLGELAELRENQKQAAERTAQLLEKMNRLSQDRADKDPETARELQAARQQALQDNLTGQMQQAKEDIQNTRIQDARKNQAGAIKALQKMVKTLEDRREAELDRLVKKMRQAEKQLDDLAVQQEELQKKVKEAQALADPQAREEALKKLGKQQKELQQKTQEMMKQLSRLRAERAGSALGKADGEMEQAGQELARGQKADEKQDDALDRLDEAQRELGKARQQAEEQLRREQLAHVEETIQRLRDRQAGLNGEAVRVQTEVQQKKEWTRSLLRGSLADLARNQQGLGVETVDVAKKELTGTPVFSRLVEKAAEAMEQAGERGLAMLKEPPPIDHLPDESLTRAQLEALRRFDQLLEALKAETAALQKKESAGGGSSGEGDADDGSSGLPPLAQLKLLRGLQEEVNKRTAAFTKAHPNLDKLTEKEKTELGAIRADQQDIAHLLEELRAANEPAGAEGDK